MRHTSAARVIWYQIIAYLREQRSAVNQLIAKIRDAIESLKELRATVISAAVAGKIDVREEIV
jgi:type I restriction enzyme S subunit